MPKVLLADDDFTMVALLKTLLKMEGYEVASLMDQTGDILENIRNEKPDIMLIDFYMGDRNGVDLVRQMRSTEDLKDIRIIMVSGIDKSRECLKAGANDFMLKPYMPEELFAKLRGEK
jgi:DNA-binding response OmpR family regulator